MYNISQIQKGINNPSLIREELRRQVRKRIPHDVGIQGSYYTGNIGDQALGLLFKRVLTNQGFKTSIFDHYVIDSNCETRILGGGGVLHDWYGVEHLERRLKYVKGGEEGYIIGVGVPGFRSNHAQKLIENSLSDVDLVTVRDERSRKNLLDICNVEVKTTACPAFLYTDPEIPSSERTGVNFRPYFNDKENLSNQDLEYYFGYKDLENAQSKYVKNAKTICNNIDDPVFIPFHQDDQNFAENYLDIPILEYEFSTQKTLEHVSSVDRMVTTRYHSLIFAAICNKPILCIAYEPKVEEVANRLNIEHHRPHEKIPLQFNRPNNVKQLESCALRNFELVFDEICKP